MDLDPLLFAERRGSGEIRINDPQVRAAGRCHSTLALSLGCRASAMTACDPDLERFGFQKLSVNHTFGSCHSSALHATAPLLCWGSRLCVESFESAALPVGSFLASRGLPGRGNRKSLQIPHSERIRTRLGRACDDLGRIGDLKGSLWGWRALPYLSSASLCWPRMRCTRSLASSLGTGIERLYWAMRHFPAMRRRTPVPRVSP